MLQSRGTGTRRSNACWTCKLRRKKCDEAQPACLACVSRTVTCHGYSIERPQWMDSGAMERAELERIQCAVKDNKRRQRKQLLQAQAEARASSFSTPSDQPGHATEVSRGIDLLADQQRPAKLSAASGRAEIDVTSSDRDRSTPRRGLSSHELSPAEEIATKPPTPAIELLTTPIVTPDIAKTDSPSVLLRPHSSSFRFSHFREAELLMHYLDVVFALQFRFHVPSVASGGRGWLLWLLTETKPLYHAALSLGALHQHSLLNRAERIRDDTLIELNDHHNRAIQELQIFLQSAYDASDVQSRERKRELQILACGVQLVSFELFRGGINVWDPHLKALATILNRTYEIGVSVDGTTYGPQGLENTAEQFLIGSVLWFDIIACASTGQAPRVMRESHDYFLGRGTIQLSNIVGCQGWVAVLIAETARLQEESRAKSFSTWELFERGSPIRQQLMHGISVLRREIDATFSTIGHTQIVLDSSVHTTAVTRAVTLAFAHATQVYLHCTVTGAYPYDNDIQATVKDTAEALREMRLITDPQAARSLVWPICIAGSMAGDCALQSYFRGLIEELGEQAHDFGNSVTVLRILERCWSHWQRRRPDEAQKSYSWFTAMEETGQRVLLV